MRDAAQALINKFGGQGWILARDAYRSGLPALKGMSAKGIRELFAKMAAEGIGEVSEDGKRWRVEAGLELHKPEPVLSRDLTRNALQTLDRQIRAINREESEEDSAEEANRRHRRLSLLLQERAEEALEYIKPEQFQVRDVIAVIKLAVEMERLSLGMATQNVAMQGKKERTLEPIPCAPEQLELDVIADEV